MFHESRLTENHTEKYLHTNSSCEAERVKKSFNLKVWRVSLFAISEEAEGNVDRMADIRIWSKSCIQTVAQEIAKRICGAKKDLNLNVISSLTRRVSTKYSFINTFSF